MEAALSLAKNAVKVRCEDIPPEILEITKIDILDLLGVTVAGCTLPGAKEVVELVKEWGGKEESTIVAYGGKVPAYMAAFANGAMAHVADYDDVDDAAVLHAAASVVPASFAIAERVGNVNGKDFITAVTLGLDTVCRMGQAPRLSQLVQVGWAGTPIFGVFGATIAASKLLGLKEEEVVNALGIAYSQASGGFQSALDGAQRKHAYGAFSAKGGVLAALLAGKGISGAKNSLEGKFGLYNLYYQGEYDPTPLTTDLGKRFFSTNLSFKPYPSCRVTHPYIDAALAIVREHNVRPQDVEEITVFVGGHAKILCEPLETKQNPPTTVQAQFSIPYTVAAAVTKRKVVLEDFRPDGIKDPATLQIARKVVPQFDPSLTTKDLIDRGGVEIRVKSGERYSERVDFPYGDPRNPISKEELIQKFRDCVLYSVKPIPKEKVDEVISMITNIEKVKDVSQIVQLLA